MKVDFSKAKRKRGRPHRTSEHESQRVRRLLRHAEAVLKAAGWRYGFRQEAERQVIAYLGLPSETKLAGMRRRGKKGGPKPAR